ncbi:MAG TPA: OpgC domain-containing protein [Candidatus Acidoferrales bacterium]
MKRDTDIDAARGFMLVWMTLTHLPTMLTPWVNQPFGYISASEGFIFLSALFTGRIYYRQLTRDGVGKMSAKLLLRTVRLYWYHVLLLLFAFVIAARFAIGPHGQGLYNLLDFYFAAGPGRALGDALLLIYRPPLLDIIPLYIIFLLLSPLIIGVSTRVGWKFILGGSFAVWLLAQFGLREMLYAALSHQFGLRIPLNEMGAFNLWAWQFVWVFGLWGGVCWSRECLPAQKWARRMWIPAALVFATLFAVRYFELSGMSLGSWEIFFDKWHLGVIRMFNFAAIAIVLIRFRSAVKPLAIRPLVLLGQSSLQVFCTHFLFCFLGIGLMGDADRIFGWRQFALIVVTFAALLFVAKIYGRHELSAPAVAGSAKIVPGNRPLAHPEREFARAEAQTR